MSTNYIDVNDELWVCYLSKKLQQVNVVALCSTMSAKKAVDRPLQKKSIINGIQANTLLI